MKFLKIFALLAVSLAFLLSIGRIKSPAIINSVATIRHAVVSPPAISLEDIVKCDRYAKIYPIAGDGMPKPPAPVLPLLKGLPVGAEGWIANLVSFEGKVYAEAFASVSNVPILKSDYDTYDTPVVAHRIHVRKVLGGVEVDCNHAADLFYVYPIDRIPVVGMFRSK